MCLHSQRLRWLVEGSGDLNSRYWVEAQHALA